MKKFTVEEAAAKIRQANSEQGNNIDPLMGTCFARMNSEAIKNVALFQRSKWAEQDGADFFDIPSRKLLARYEYPFTSRSNDWFSLEAAQEAAAMFLRDNPTYKLTDGE